MLPMSPPEGSTYRLMYRGPVGVSGVGAQQTWDLSGLPDGVRADPSFVDNWRVFVRSVGAGITAVSEDVEFVNGPDGLPAGLRLTLTAAAPTDEISLEAWYMHSVIR